MRAPIIVLTGPPGTGKTTVAQLLADHFDRSAVVQGDDFFRYLRAGRIEPWRPESHDQNGMVMDITAQATAGYAAAGFATVLEGIVGPWFIDPLAAHWIGSDVHYLVLEAPRQVARDRVVARGDDPDRVGLDKMHAEFERAAVAPRHRLDATSSPTDVAHAAITVIRDHTALWTPTQHPA